MSTPIRPPRTITGLSQLELVRLLVNLRNRFYPWMHILHRADGTVIVTINPRPEEGPRD